jgi:aryl-alcohol dehydrogenase-like predicted oxidoreductase
MVRSLEQSLKRLRTDRIDLYWVHVPDAMTPIDEIVRGLDDLVRAGKVLYAGFSDFQAWRTSAASMLAELRGWATIAAQQVEYSLVQRTPERELLPMAAAFGLATAAWSPLGGGILTGKAETGAFTFAADASNAAAVVGLFEGADRRLGEPDVVVYNAGARARGPIT